MLGGAFNPPHIGHLVLAQEAAAQLGLDRVHLVTTGRAPHKRITDDPGASTRHEMTEIAARGNEMLVADRSEVQAAEEADEPSYTVDTLRRLRPGRGEELVLLMGADAAAAIESWREPRELARLAEIAIAARPGVAIAHAEAALDRIGAAATAVPMPEVGVSSTGIRQRVAEGRPVRYLVPDGVLELIEAMGLYRR